MGVLSELSGHVVVNDCFHTLDIETTRSQICSQKVVHLAKFELVQSSETLQDIRMGMMFEQKTDRTCSCVKLPCNSAAFMPKRPNKTLI